MLFPLPKLHERLAGNGAEVREIERDRFRRGIPQIRLKIGEEAMDLLLALLEGKTPKKTEVLLRAELIVRNSVGRSTRD